MTTRVGSVKPQYRAWPLRALGALDDLLYRLRAPHVLVVVPVLLMIAALFALAWW